MIAVIPAAGDCARFRGIPKECLPDRSGIPLIESAIARANWMGCDHAVVVTSTTKSALHERLLDFHGVTIIHQADHSPGLWGAIRCTFPFRQDSLLVLPDTVFEEPVGGLRMERPMAFGLFETKNPGRFSVFQDGRILTKNDILQGTQLAWGCVAWKKEVIDFWEKREVIDEYEDYDPAFQHAAANFGFDTFDIANYRDLGTFEDYREYLTEKGKPCCDCA